MAFDHITLPPNQNQGASEIGALVEALGMNVLFDDVTDLPGVRFCFQESEDTAILDYEITDEDLEAWHAGERSLELFAKPHDPAIFG